MRMHTDCSLFFSIVGGIYSVIKSKAPVTTAEYGDRYTLIGPLHDESVGLAQGTIFVLQLLPESVCHGMVDVY